MKYLIVFIVFAFLFGCKKDPEPFVLNLDEYSGEATSLRDGQSWQGHVFVRQLPTNSLSIGIDSLSQFGKLKQQVSFTYVKKTIGKHALKDSSWVLGIDPGFSGSMFGLNDNDEILGLYDVFEDELSNHFEITKLDTLTNEIEGTFTMTYLAIAVNSETGYPDTVRFTDGKFKAIIE